jgi:hypothetical protein
MAVSLAALRAAAKDDAVIAEQVAKLETYKDGIPALTQLCSDLAAQETRIAAPDTSDADHTIQGRLQKIMRPLISVHALHDPQFADLEKALDAHDAAAALAAFDALSDGTKQSLSACGAQLQARAAIDEALAIIDAHFMGISDAPTIKSAP